MLLVGPGFAAEPWYNQVHGVVGSIADAAMACYAGCEVPFSMARTRRVTAGSPRPTRSRRGTRAWRPGLAGQGGASSRWNWWFVRGDHAWAR